MVVLFILLMLAMAIGAFYEGATALALATSAMHQIYAAVFLLGGVVALVGAYILVLIGMAGDIIRQLTAIETAANAVVANTAIFRNMPRPDAPNPKDNSSEAETRQTREQRFDSLAAERRAPR